MFSETIAGSPHRGHMAASEDLRKREVRQRAHVAHAVLAQPGPARVRAPDQHQLGVREPGALEASDQIGEPLALAELPHEGDPENSILWVLGGREELRVHVPGDDEGPRRVDSGLGEVLLMVG
jgi:hypothetical protein